jgi:hypothetical protein
MRAFIPLLLITLVSNSVFLNSNSETLSESEPQQYITELFSKLDVMSSGLMNFIQTKINDELFYKFKNSASLFINTMKKKTYYQFRKDFKKYLYDIGNKIQDFDYQFVFNYVVEEIQSLVKYVNTTTFNDLLEKMISDLRNDINNLNITEIQYEFSKIEKNIKNYDIEKIILDIVKELDYLKKKNYPEERIKRDISEIKYDLVKGRGEVRGAITQTFDSIKSAIEFIKLNYTDFSKDISFDKLNENLFPFIKELNIEKVKEVLKYFIGEIKNILKSPAMKKIKDLLKELLEVQNEYINKDFRDNLMEIIETILNGDYIDEPDYSLFKHIYEWIVKFINKIDKQSAFELELSNLIKDFRTYNFHSFIDKIALYAKRCVGIGINFIVPFFEFIIPFPLYLSQI